MNLIKCRKCGAVVIGRDTMIEGIVDAMNDANARARYGPKSLRNAAIQEAAEYNTLLKGVLHYESVRIHAEAVAPVVVKELCRYIREHGLMTPRELDDLCAAAKRKAARIAEEAEKAENQLYGTFDAISNDPAYRDPTAKAAIASADRDLRRGKT
ncbi:MAG: hypothetical protein K6F19_06270 [Oscillospiraceae bacterium]|nr:hypothetical protein [Oscillospiraceae bacterium]